MSARLRDIIRGWHVETFGGGRYTAVAWFLLREDAEREVARRLMIGAWSGMPPRVTPGRERSDGR